MKNYSKRLRQAAKIREKIAEAIPGRAYVAVRRNLYRKVHAQLYGDERLTLPGVIRRALRWKEQVAGERQAS